MSFFRRCVFVSALAVASTSSALAADIAFFDNPTYTDPTRESALLLDSLAELGHSTFVFDGITAADWEAATAGVDLLIIPELDSGDLYPDLSPDAVDAIFNYVNNGGGLVMFDRSDAPTPNMLNGIFGFSLVGGSGGVTTLNAAAAAGTPFEGGPASLPDSNATELFTTASLPAGALDLYNDGGGQTSVFWVAQGSGTIGYLAFDWFEDPSPAEWEDVLGRMIEATAAPIDNARFRVTKTFSDGSTDEIEVMLTCNTGLPLEQTFTIEGGDPEGVTFVVTDIPEPGATCEVTESGAPNGYTTVLNGGDGCVWEDVVVGSFTCEITNEANPATYTVFKDFTIQRAGGDVVIAEADITIECDSEIQGYDWEDDGYWYLTGTLSDGESLVATVDTTEGPATCSASETITQSGVEQSSSGCGAVELPAGGSHTCTFTNTVFFEGIPTLSQYGLAILVLLTLGVGFVGLRRFV